jgi:predicted lysophospholipase L1 biosynthesis ABC-type transport system permease subunit
MEPESEQQPVKEARSMALVVVGGIALVLVILLAIVLIIGDPTDHLQERQPEPSPSSIPR